MGLAFFDLLQLDPYGLPGAVAAVRFRGAVRGGGGVLLRRVVRGGGGGPLRLLMLWSAGFLPGIRSAAKRRDGFFGGFLKTLFVLYRHSFGLHLELLF